MISFVTNIQKPFRWNIDLHWGPEVSAQNTPYYTYGTEYMYTNITQICKKNTACSLEIEAFDSDKFVNSILNSYSDRSWKREHICVYKYKPLFLSEESSNPSFDFALSCQRYLAHQKHIYVRVSMVPNPRPSFYPCACAVYYRWLIIRLVFRHGHGNWFIKCLKGPWSWKYPFSADVSWDWTAVNKSYPLPPPLYVFDKTRLDKTYNLLGFCFTINSRLEDTITFHLIERVQFPLNKRIYVPGGVKIPNSELSLLDWMLREQERLQSRVRRYQSPDEYPFFPDDLESPILQPIEYPRILHDNDVNVNHVIKSRYVNEILPNACRKFDREDRGETQENYGSSATCDVSCLQALSRRIHFGKFVAESKFRTETEKFVKLIKDEDREGIDDAITNKQVERKVLERLRLKARTYGTDPSNPNTEKGNEKINVEAVVAMYKVSSYFPFSALSLEPLRGVFLWMNTESCYRIA